MNTSKTVLLMALMTVLFVVVGNLIGGQNGMVMAFIIATVMNVGSYWFSDKIVLRTYGAQEITQADAPEVYQMTRELAAAGGIPMPKLYMIRGDQPNAFATGRNPEHAAVAVTEGIARLLTRDELRGVISHELSHVKHRDILIGTIAATMAGAISMLGHMAFAYGGGRSSDERGGGSAAGGLVAMLVAPFAAMLIQMAISRTREYSADAVAAQYTGAPGGLIGALRKLDTWSQRVPMDASPATAHMFIVKPFTGASVMRLFSTHPATEQRIARLQALA